MVIDGFPKLTFLKCIFYKNKVAVGSNDQIIQFFLVK